MTKPLREALGAEYTTLYLIALRLYSMLERASHISLRLLQSLLLLAFSEIEHGILLAGYLRVGHAARSEAMMGFHDRNNAAVLLELGETWTLR